MTPKDNRRQYMRQSSQQHSHFSGLRISPITLYTSLTMGIGNTPLRKCLGNYRKIIFFTFRLLWRVRKFVVKAMTSSNKLAHISKISNRQRDPMAANVIKSYGQGNQRAEDAIDTALVTATNTISIVEDNDQGSILPTLSAAVRDIFNIPEADDIETIAAVGNIETAPINATENNWNYFVALNSIEMGDLELQAKQLCELLETGGDQTSLAERLSYRLLKY